MTNRRGDIADAGIRILASRGARAFTHLTIDRELQLPDGSTSYYARTRRDLINLVVERLATRTIDDLTAQAIPEELTPHVMASLVVGGLDAMMLRVDDHRARLVLLLECRTDPELHTALATRPTVRGPFVDTATAMLRSLGVVEPETHARDLTGLIDGLLMQRVIRAETVNEESILVAYLAGLTTNDLDPLVEGTSSHLDVAD